LSAADYLPQRHQSVEASSKDFATEAPQAIAFLRRAFSNK
jgi:hypothetical protein